MRPRIKYAVNGAPVRPAEYQYALSRVGANDKEISFFHEKTFTAGLPVFTCAVKRQSRHPMRT